MLSRIGLISDVATTLRPRVRNHEGAVGAVHHVHDVAGFGKVGRLLNGEEGRSGRGSAVRVFSRRAHVVAGGACRWRVTKQGKRKDRQDDAGCAGAGASAADGEGRCSDPARSAAKSGHWLVSPVPGDADRRDGVASPSPGSESFLLLRTAFPGPPVINPGR